MRIISDFKDYYDSLQDFDSPVWNRTYQSIIEKDREFKNLFAKLNDLNFSTSKRNSLNKYIHKISVIFGFCGTYTKYIMEIEEDFDDIVVSEDFLLPSNKDSFNLIEVTKENDSNKWSSGSFLNKDISFLNQYDLFIRYNSPTILIHPFQLKDQEKRRNFKVIVNPSLRKLGYHNKKDIHQVYQELDMYVSGVLCNRETRPELKDKHRMGGRFDKWSFRKVPEKVK